MIYTEDNESLLQDHIFSSAVSVCKNIRRQAEIAVSGLYKPYLLSVGEYKTQVEGSPRYL